MKKLIFTYMLMVAAFSLSAQDKIMDRTQDHDKTQDQIRLHDYLLFQDGVFLHIRDQDRDRDQLRDQIKLNDGSIASVDGYYTTSSGERIRLNDGECLDMDGNRYASQDQFRQHLRIREQALNQTHYQFSDGKVYRVQNQVRVQTSKPVDLDGNGVLKPDGSLRLKKQDRIRLRDGECVDPEGNQYASQIQFRQQAQLRLQAIAQDHYLFQNGNMYRVQNQQQTRLQTQVRLNNGIEINPDGKFQLRNQEQMQLRNGECLDPEGNVYASQNQFREQTQLRLMANNQQHFIFQNGNTYQVVNQQRFQLREPLALQNGMVINPDGRYQMRSQAENRLRDGECLDPEGNRYASQEQYQSQVQNRFIAMAEPHFYFKNGQVYQYQNNVQTTLTNSKRLQNGVTVFPDGRVQEKNQTREKMRDGEYLDWQGARYENQDRFRERMEQRIQDRQEIRDRERVERKDVQQTRRRAGG